MSSNAAKGLFQAMISRTGLSVSPKRARKRFRFSILTLTAFVSIPSARSSKSLHIAHAQIKESARRNFKFDFGAGKAAPGRIRILSTTIYAKERGYGFEPGANVVCIYEDERRRAASHGSCSSDKPFFFSVALPEGNYRVTATFGDAKSETDTTVKAELRRLMLERVHTSAGKFETRAFTVNTRTPRIAGDGEVKLKERERTTEAWAWDEKLTLEFNGAHPAIRALEIEPADDVPTIFLLGDSTVADQPREPYSSWGQMLTRFFTPDVAVANHAESGESLRSSLAAHRLDKVLSMMKPGDYLFIQYGHNDEKERGESGGAFTTYKADLKRFVEAARARGGVPVLITPMHRRTFDAQGNITNSHGDYPEAVRQAAREERVPLIDLNTMSKDLYEAFGTEESGALFKSGDATHHSGFGSYELAKCVIEGIKANRLAIGKFIAPDMNSFDPRRPDAPESFHVPPSPQTTDAKPLGS